MKGFDLILVLVGVAWAIVGGISQSRAKKKKEAQAAARRGQGGGSTKGRPGIPSGGAQIKVTPRQARAAKIRSLQAKSQEAVVASRQRAPVPTRGGGVAPVVASKQRTAPRVQPLPFPPPAVPVHEAAAATGGADMSGLRQARSPVPLGSVSPRPLNRCHLSLRQAVVYKTILEPPKALSNPQDDF